MHRQLENAAILISRLELAAEDVEPPPSDDVLDLAETIVALCDR